MFGDMIVLDYFYEDDFIVNMVKIVEFYWWLLDKFLVKYEFVFKMDIDFWVNVCVYWDWQFFFRLDVVKFVDGNIVMGYKVNVNYIIIGQFYYDNYYCMVFFYGVIYIVIWDIVNLLFKL